jgi:glutaminyl-tRNA synthetase
MSEELIVLFQDIGLSEAKSKETAKNVNLSKTLETLIRYCKGSDKDLKPVGLLIYHIASKIKPQIMPHLNKLADYVSIK